MRYFLLIITIFFTGCTTMQLPITDYRVAPKVELKPYSSNCRKHSIKVVPLFVNSALLTKTMHYRVGEYKEYNYTQSQWSDAPNKVIANRLVEVLSESGLYNGVYGYKSANSGELILEMSVNEFIQTFNKEENSSQAVVDISFNLTDRKSGKFLQSKTFRKTEQTQSVDAQGGVETLNKLLSEVFAQSVVWLSRSSL